MPLYLHAWTNTWWLFSKEKPAVNHAAIRSNLQYVNEASSHEKIPLSYYLKQKTGLFTSFTYSYILLFFLTWFPSYLLDTHDLNVKEMSVVTVIPWVFGLWG